MNSDELTPFLLRHAYEQGAFPMTLDDGSVGWFQPIRRALFAIEGIHVSRSLKRTLRSGRFEFRFDTSFESVMRGCLRPDDNWISEAFIRAYGEVHRLGWAHCSETWLDGKLVGGVYGLQVGSCFCAESMFHRVTDASKAALWALVERCREEGFTLFDAQVMNPHLASLGAFEVPHGAYMERLRKALKKPLPHRSWQECKPRKFGG
ncbi:MAG: leucyl/phenylalanyl-tRNA--protein transferase [Chthonomonadaceae bacterium]|nr:leucyl/phenylalanyl-tRNA--protein transferase [Chthonomonadaceae bacterium]